MLGGPRGLLHLHYQDSTGSEPDRQAGANWLGRRIDGVAADDPYAPLRPERIVAMAELAPDITWHIATL